MGEGLAFLPAATLTIIAVGDSILCILAIQDREESGVPDAWLYRITRDRAYRVLRSTRPEKSLTEEIDVVVAEDDEQFNAEDAQQIHDATSFHGNIAKCSCCPRNRGSRGLPKINFGRRGMVNPSPSRWAAS